MKPVVSTLFGNIHIAFFSSGVDFGLGLSLNIEQYEYIDGPNIDAGIKVKSK